MRSFALGGSSRGWAQGLMIAILAVVCPRQILFWLTGVGGVEVPVSVLAWADGIVGAATAVTMTGGQMYLVHHLTTVVLTPGREGWRIVVCAVLAVTWLVVMAVTIVIGSSHVVMQVAGEPLLEILQVDWVLSNLPTWLVGLTTVAALELTAAGLALAHADALAGALERQVREAKAARDAALVERNAERDSGEALRRRLRAVESKLGGLGDGGRERGQAVRVPCRYGCGWISNELPEERARRAERAHVGHRHRGDDERG